MDENTSDQADEPHARIDRINAASGGMRGRIAEELSEPTDHFSDESAELLKFHGVYQHSDRDRHLAIGESRSARRVTYQFMVRTNVPGGRLTSEQMLSQLALADEFGDGTLRITNRQELQLYGLAKPSLETVLRRINHSGLTTIASCADAARNVVCCPAPYRGDPVHGEMQWLAARLAEELRPRMPAYQELWVNESPTASSAAQENAEPLYGDAYLPQKFKIAFGLPGDNCADLYSQDCGLMAICENYHVVGYNVLVGGGMGITSAKDAPFASLAQRMATASPDQVIDVVKAIVKVFRDFGDRGERSRSRLKYLVADWGIERFKEKVESCLGYTLPPPRPDEVWDIDDHLGWREQGDGGWFYGLHVENGRIQEQGESRLKSALREICEKRRPAILLTPAQGLLIGDIRWEDRLSIEDLLRRYGVKSEGEISNVRRWSAGCASLPTCPMALTESERALPNLIDQLEVELNRMGLSRDLFSVRMTGCANGCSRPFNADIGIVGRSAGRYAIYLGGRRIGNRVGFLYLEGIPLEQVVDALTPALAYFQQARGEGETFGDFCHRKGREDLLQMAKQG